MKTIDKWNDETKEYLKKLAGIYIYGAGNWGRIITKYCILNGIKINGVIVCDTSSNINEIYRVPVIAYTNTYDKNTPIIVAIDKEVGDEVFKMLVEDGWSDIFRVSVEPKCYEGYDFNTNLSYEWYEEELKLLFWLRTKQVLNLDNPRGFNEKIQWIKLRGFTDTMTMLADKCLARNWVKEKIGEQYLVPLLGEWDSVSDIDFEMLPEKFVLKCNHGCAFNYIVNDKSNLDISDVKYRLSEWLGIDYSKCSFEMQYQNIKKKIIAEEYLENENDDLYDYKFWCYNGKVEFIMFLSGRKTGLMMDNYSVNWELLDFTYNYPNSGIIHNKPQRLADMINIAEKLATGFPFVRVDLYLLNDGTIKFGEMTFTPASGMCVWSNADVDVKYGNLFDIIDIEN